MNIDKYIETLKSNQLLSERDIKLVCDRMIEILSEESNVQPVNAPVNVCGDIHGQFYDLLQLFEIGGEIPTKRYIFIGDLVDRGYHSIETVSLLFCYKIKYPDCITILRGNHESRMITRTYGFYEEVQRKYGNINVWTYCTDTFDYFPIAALIEGRVLSVHGGLSPSIKTLDQIRGLDRVTEIPCDGPFADLMWSDPEDIDTWAYNSRGAGLVFGGKVTKEFNHLNGLELITRAHQLVMEGYIYWFKEKSLVTVWSAPNYCYRCGNNASILEIDENLERNWKIFYAAEESMKSKHPRTVLPYFL